MPARLDEAVPVGEAMEQPTLGWCAGPTTHSILHTGCGSGKRAVSLSHYATLAYQRKPADKPWEAQRVLIVPPFSNTAYFTTGLRSSSAGAVPVVRLLVDILVLPHRPPRNRRALMMSPTAARRGNWPITAT
jgi:hypothetical protein